MPGPSRRRQPEPRQPALLEAEGVPSLEPEPGAPLAARMRPRTFDEYLGQDHLVGRGRLLRRLIEAGQLPSLILWGPPGSGKTTLARIIASLAQAHFVAISAVSAGVADLRRVIAEAQTRKAAPPVRGEPASSVRGEPVEPPRPSTSSGGTEGPARPEALEGRPASEALSSPSPSSERGLGREVRRTILFIDEIHRFNKAQQDAVLPYVEDGTVTLIGATTENPSFEVIGPLLSRSRVFTLKALTEPDLAALIRRAVEDPERGLGGLNIVIDDDAVEALAASVGGDARIALNALEAAAFSVLAEPEASRGSGGAAHAGGARGVSPRNSNLSLTQGGADQRDAQPSGQAGQRHITRAVIEEALQHRTYLYDRQGDAHYDTISAFIKSLRGSDPDAALYWLARMIEAGEDPLFIIRRMVILAAEDIGLADPQALVVATACQQAVHFIGMPEGFLPLAETALYLALAPKSNSALTAYSRALADVEATRNDPVPLHLRNAVTGLMHQEGYGRGYMYAHDYEGGIAPGQTYLPERLKGHRYYIPRNLGQEKKISAQEQADPESNSSPS